MRFAPSGIVWPLHRARLMVLLLLLSACVPVVVRMSSKRLAVAVAVDRGYRELDSDFASAMTIVVPNDDEDPWNHRLCYTFRGGRVTLYSAGPNGWDDLQAGDDIVPTASELAIGRALVVAPKLLVAAAALVAWVALVLAPRGRGDLRVELARSLWIASVPLLMAVALDAWLREVSSLWARLSDLDAWQNRQPVMQSMLPLSLTLPLSGVLVGWVLALAWRLRRESSSSDAMPVASGEEGATPPEMR